MRRVTELQLGLDGRWMRAREGEGKLCSILIEETGMTLWLMAG